MRNREIGTLMGVGGGGSRTGKFCLEGLFEEAEFNVVEGFKYIGGGDRFLIRSEGVFVGTCNLLA